MPTEKEDISPLRRINEVLNNTLRSELNRIPHTNVLTIIL